LGASHSFLHGQNLDINFANMKEVAVTVCSQIKKSFSCNKLKVLYSLFTPLGRLNKYSNDLEPEVER
jgi:hypothetical protein